MRVSRSIASILLLMACALVGCEDKTSLSVSLSDGSIPKINMGGLYWHVLRYDNAELLDMLVDEGLPIDEILTLPGDSQGSSGESLFADGQTVLMLACVANATNCIRRLLSRSFDPTVRSVNGTTLFHFASCLKGVFAIQFAEAILRRYALCTDSENNAGQTPLFWAMTHENVDYAQWLLSRGSVANRRYQSSRMERPRWYLFEAVNHSDAVFRFCMKSDRFDKLVKDETGLTLLFALDAMMVDNYDERLEEIVRHGFDINSTWNGKTILNELIKDERYRQLTVSRLQRYKAMGMSADQFRGGLEFAGSNDFKCFELIKRFVAEEFDR